jgi:hypothetical protein
MKRKNEEMQGELSSLRQLYDFLRLKPEHEAFEILRQIRETPGDTPVSQRIKELADSVRQEDRDESSSRQPPVTQPPDDALALPPIGMALHSLGPDTEAYLKNLPFPHSILNMDPQGRASQRRKYASDADVSTQLVLVRVLESASNNVNQHQSPFAKSGSTRIEGHCGASRNVQNF